MFIYKLHTENGQLLSGKGAGHGMGIPSIEHIAKEHNGICRYSYTDNEFLMEVVLDTSVSPKPILLEV